MDPTYELLVVLLVVLAASSFQAAVGFGANLIAMPIVVQLRPDLVPGSVLLATLALNGIVALRERRSVDLRPLSAAGVGAVVGSALGAVVVSRASTGTLQLLVAGSVLAMVTLMATVHVAPRRTTPNLVTAGTASGFASVTAGIGGPPMALLFADAEGPRIRGSLSTFFLLTTTLSLTGLHLAGRLGGDELAAALLLVPAVLAGYLSGRPLTTVVDRGRIRPLVLVASGGSALLLLARLALG